MWESLLPSEGVWSMQGDEIDHLHQNTAWARPSASPAPPGAHCWRRRMSVNVPYSAATGKNISWPFTWSPFTSLFTILFCKLMGRQWNVVLLTKCDDQHQQSHHYSATGKPADLIHLPQYIIISVFNCLSEFPMLHRQLPCFLRFFLICFCWMCQ